MNMHNVLTQEAEEAVVLEFLQMHKEIAQEDAIREACKVLITYCTITPMDDDEDDEDGEAHE